MQGALENENDAANKTLPFVGIAKSKNPKMIAQLKSRAQKIRDSIGIVPLTFGGDIETGSLAYDAGCIYYKKYTMTDLPDDEQLIEDINNYIDVYEKYYSDIYVKPNNSNSDEVPSMTRRAQLDHIKSYIAAEGFSYNDGLIENFYLSLKTKPFVILAGISGTGKTRLVKLFAEAVGATAENGRFKLVAVRPDWSDSSDLFGHVDLNGQFLPGAILDFVKQAGEDLEKPYFLCLDEMNLARVEYYLSDVLSIMETRDRNEAGEIVTDPLLGVNLFGADEDAIEKYGNLRIPENLYIVGTVNMDETTFPFSKKVLDRANTLEFSHVDLNPLDNEDLSETSETLDLSNVFLKTDYLRLKDCDREDGVVDALCSELEALNAILKQSNAQVGYRVRDEFVFYCLNNRAQQLLSDDEAKDNEILQKLLPRIHGSTVSVKRMLCDLFKHCAGDFDSLQTENNEAGEQMEKRLSSGGARYPNSAHKIAFMIRSFEENGFTSFWLQ